MNPIVQVENLSKQYRLGKSEAAYATLRETIVNAASAPFKFLRRGRSSNNSEHPTIWALKDVNFTVQPGEVVGIIGGNGAGKSTLLKVLSRITEPTKGTIRLYGRVGSLLEVGTGFHPELSGRENIYLNGAILGMRKTEIQLKFDEIVAFAELERFLDTPVKHYSSGMYMRLAFAVAAHLEPEILLVDEVLAVGDAIFQKKCLGKMGEVAKEGRTVIFVSHNMAAVQSLCSRVVWLNTGIMRDEGRPSDVISNYIKTSLSVQSEQVWDDPDAAPGNEQVRIRRASVRPVNDAPMAPINVNTPLAIDFEYWNLVAGSFLNLSVVIKTEEGYPIFNTGSGSEPVWHGKPFPSGLFRSTFYIPANLLNDGTHRVHLYVVRDQSVVIYDTEDILIFDVEDDLERRAVWYGKWIGAVRPSLKWETEFLGETVAEVSGQ